MNKFKKLILAFLTLFIISVPLGVLGGCSLIPESGNEEPPRVSYGTATINYHYDYDSYIESYWKEKYSVPMGGSYEVEIEYTPPIRQGYRFLGWTLNNGGEGDLIGDKYEIVGSGFGGTLYNFYAKYEIIEYNVVYHLDGGTNSENNPTTLTGAKALSKPTKENYEFEGWYFDEGFDSPTSRITLRDNDETTVHLYAKWRRIYKINYVAVNDATGETITRLKVGDLKNLSYKENNEKFTVLLKKELFENYHWLGWTYEGQTEKGFYGGVVIPENSEGDLTFTAHYLEATNPRNTEGTEVLVQVNYGQITFTLPEGVQTVVVEDICNTSYSGVTYVRTAIIKYRGEVQPEVICAEGIDVIYEKID